MPVDASQITQLSYVIGFLIGIGIVFLTVREYIKKCTNKLKGKKESGHIALAKKYRQINVPIVLKIIVEKQKLDEEVTRIETYINGTYRSFALLSITLGIGVLLPYSGSFAALLSTLDILGIVIATIIFILMFLPLLWWDKKPR